MHVSEIKIKGERFVLIPKKEFDVISRRAAKKSSAGISHRDPIRRRKTIAILDQWESSPCHIDDAEWEGLKTDISANRFRLRPPVDD